MLPRTPAAFRSAAILDRGVAPRAVAIEHD